MAHKVCFLYKGFSKYFLVLQCCFLYNMDLKSRLAKKKHYPKLSLIKKQNLELIQKIQFYRGGYFLSNAIESYLASMITGLNYIHTKLTFVKILFFFFFPFFCVCSHLKIHGETFLISKETQFVMQYVLHCFYFENLFGQNSST